MKKFSKILLSSLATAPLLLNTLPFAAADETGAAPGASQTAPAKPVELSGENISFQYVSTVFNGQEQKPAVTVRSGETVLAEKTDFTVTYPKDCVNAGKKTVTIEGIGKYSGKFSATYMIEPLDCSEKNSNVKISIADCYYSGMPLMPGVTITANGLTLESGDYILAFSDNVNATSEKKAKCEITFRGNFSGSRIEEFDIAKTASKDFGIQVMVHNGDRIVYDLTPLKPEGAIFGTVKYYIWDYVEEHQPKIAFNELSFTVPDNLTGSTAIVIPVKNAPNREDYNIVFYPSVTDKVIPTVTLRSSDREYNGEPISADVFTSNGSYAMADGKRIEGTWEFWTEPPLLPCDKKPCIITFTPNDPQYDAVDTLTFITVSRSKASEFMLKPHRTEISVWQSGQLVISGIPEDYKGTVTLRCSSDDKELKIKEVFCDDITQREFEIDFPFKGGKFTFTAELSGDGLYLPASSQCSITVGDQVPPEEKPSDKITTADELKALIASAAEGGTVKAEGMRSVPADIIKAAFDKHLTLQVKLNDNYTWIVDTTKLSSQGELDLDISTAVIPAVLLDKVGGENLFSFNVFAKDLGNAAKLQVSSERKNNGFANLFLYNTSGELKFVSCAPVRPDGTAELDIKDSGKYAVMIDSETKLAGDMDNNCAISMSDIASMLNQYLRMSPGTKAEGKYLKYDVNGDGIVTLADVANLLTKYLSK